MVKQKGPATRQRPRPWTIPTRGTDMDDLTLDRFMERVLKRHGCWNWIGSLSGYGYATFRMGGKIRRAHRVSYEHFTGPIPEGYHVDHRCRVKHCVNPAHLEAVPAGVNARRNQLTAREHFDARSVTG